MRLIIVFALAIAAAALGGWSWHYEREAVAIQLGPDARSHAAEAARKREDQVEVAREVSGRLAWEGAAAGALALVLGVWWFISQLMGWGERIALLVAMLVGAAVPAALVYLGPLHL